MVLCKDAEALERQVATGVAKHTIDLSRPGAQTRGDRVSPRRQTTSRKTSSKHQDISERQRKGNKHEQSKDD